MSELSTFWHIWVSAIVIGSMVACGILLVVTKRGQNYDEETDQTTGHAFDGIEELDNPLPKWWNMFFWVTIVFGFAYILIYGVGDWRGFSNWSSHSQWEAEVAKAEEKFAPYYEKLNAMGPEELIQSDEAMATGQRIYASNCSICHGSTAQGSLGFPNLTDNDWLYGGSFEAIKTTLLQGRQGAMPANGLMPNMTESQRNDVTAYVLSLSGREGSGDAENGKPLYMQACVACHGVDAKGNQAVGAPNLTDNIWLYGGSEKQINFTLKHGRNGVMPAWKEILGEDKIHVLAGYVYSLSKKDQE
ncbi:cytochrome-c oxidase, cbb3-type subunit III [Bermanella marisrubri]|uniref:Cbb3-type cytochrome c oxidase subunit n=1 Tax=Bermanella marisrubri TaxID=207949 RepID=Q1N683_9GAMM|nr:cytochrome-c oxidase, cbb3-type subunit III [Bermanella marisrubri]EAT13709.1 cytochrome c oxidase, cbb3-type, subunit III [Oceanobacter sp. RED65] [Bermanella marisrubri]QIZ84485.1 cytochrome-c oxidase, cbb3-type subunit III [Bermanella marisrubri]